MATINTGLNAKKFVKPAYIVATMFASENETTPSGDSYILEDVIEDTTTISQDDNDINDIECETSDSPIYSIVKLGKYQFAAEVADTQKDLVVALMNFTASEDGKKVYAPSQYKTKYAKIDIVFEDADGKLTAFILPKVQMNSRLMMESLNSNLARINLAGTGKDAVVDDVKTPQYIDYDYTLPAGE